MKHFIVLAIVSWLLIPGLAHADLSPKDDGALTDAFETISAGWVESVANSATDILCKMNDDRQPLYTAAEWERWFQKFFNASNHAYVDSLADYLVYPVFYWCNDAVRLNLQMGLINPMWTKITNSTSAHPADLGKAMFRDSLLRQNLFNGHALFTKFGESDLLDMTVRTSISINYKNYIKTYLQYFTDSATIDNLSQPFVALLRAHVWVSFGQSVPINTIRRGEIASTIGLGRVNPKKLDIWNDFTVLVIDNNGLDLTQLNVIYNLLKGIPSGLHNLRYVTARDFFSLPASWDVIREQSSEKKERWLFSEKSGTVNIYWFKVGSSAENPFPPDIAPVYDDQFASIATHEFNHIVDRFVVTGNVSRQDRRKQLLAQTGSAPLQYLRSMYVNTDGTSIFRDMPEEFFASISQEYFADTWHTFDLALKRFDKGYKEPINQFLFFADVYSKGGLTTKFYTRNKKGDLTVSDVPIYRDLFENITEITRTGSNKIYRFVLDFNGNVLLYRTLPAKPAN